MPAIARQGDAISHGGTITGGATRTLVEGNPVARQGDPVQCAQHGMQSITGGSSIVMVEGQAVARVGDLVSCGATISSGAGTVEAG